jgi:DNA-binding transcriptional regulator YdaS (Cro superfamily)
MNNGFMRLIGYFGSKAKTGRALGVTPQAVTKWENTNVPSERAIQIEQITKGEITVRDLRPDLYETTAA